MIKLWIISWKLRLYQSKIMWNKIQIINKLASKPFFKFLK